MSLVNAKEINAVAINADSGTKKDASFTMSCVSSGMLLETRVVPSAIALTTHSDGSIDRPIILSRPSCNFTCKSTGMLKLAIPLYLDIEFDNSTNMQLDASEIFNMSTAFTCTTDGELKKFSIYRKARPAIVFTLHSLQYLNSGRIKINKDKYL